MKTFALHRPDAIITTSSNNNEAEFISVQTFQVKTIPTKPKREININNINSIDDLQTIKRQDPFMYYSIPGVRSAKMLMKDDNDIDTSNLGVSSLKMRTCTPLYPSRIPSNTKTRRTVRRDSTKNDDCWDQQQQSSHKIERSTCISFECYPDLLLDDEDLFDDDDDDDHLGDFDIFALLTGQ
jgi:hypothetical protein